MNIATWNKTIRSKKKEENENLLAEKTKRTQRENETKEKTAEEKNFNNLPHVEHRY